MSNKIILSGLVVLALTAVFVFFQYSREEPTGVTEAPVKSEPIPYSEPTIASEEASVNQAPEPVAVPAPRAELIGHLAGYSSSYEQSRVSISVEDVHNTIETIELKTSITAEGDFTFDDLPAGLASLYLEISSGSELFIGSGTTLKIPPVTRQLGQVELVPGLNESTFQLVDLHKNSPLTVTVLVNGEPQRDVMVFARSMEEQEYLFEKGTAGDTGSDRELKLRGVVTTTTDSQGEGKFSAFFSGRWTFLASASDRSWTWVFPDIVFLTADAAQELLFDIEAFPGSLVITDSVTGQPLANVEIHFYNNFSEQGFRLWTDKNGVIDADLPMATYYIEPYPRTHYKPSKIDWLDPDQNTHLVALYQRPD